MAGFQFFYSVGKNINLHKYLEVYVATDVNIYINFYVMHNVILYINYDANIGAKLY